MVLTCLYTDRFLAGSVILHDGTRLKTRKALGAQVVAQCRMHVRT